MLVGFHTQGMARHGLAWHGKARKLIDLQNYHSYSWHGKAWQGWAGRGKEVDRPSKLSFILKAWLGKARLGKARHGKARSLAEL